MPTPPPNQSQFFAAESWNYFQRNYDGKDLHSIPMKPSIQQLVDAYEMNLDGGDILDIGCGPANNLNHLRRRFQARRAVGIEPSDRVVAALCTQFPELEFHTGDCRCLPFENHSFDLTTMNGVLCWVDPEDLYHVVGEAIRVTRGFLLITDFAPVQPYSTPYKHQPAYRTYKRRWQPVVEASGLMRCVAARSWEPENPWRAVQAALFQRIPIDEAFPIRSEADFQKKSISTHAVPAQLQAA